MEDEGQCVNCGTDEFLFDYRRGSVTCAECGCVERSSLTLHTAHLPNTYNVLGSNVPGPLVHETAPVGEFSLSVVHAKAEAAKFRSNSPPYRRETYWSERCSQWQLREPEIDYYDMERIRDKWDEFRGKFADPNCDDEFLRNQKWPKDHVMDKDNCRTVLWAIDCDIPKFGGTKPYFVKKYLVSLFFFPFFTRALSLR